MSRHSAIALIITASIALIGGGTLAYTHAQKQPAAVSGSRQSSSERPAPAPQTGSGFDKAKYSNTEPTSIWVIVNKQRPLHPDTYAPADLVNAGNGQYLRAEAAAALANLFSDARAAGYTLSAASGYRSYDTQVTVYNKEVADFGQAVADSESARPGYSEHQTGLSVDIAGGGCVIEDCFGTTPEGRWTAAHAAEYGFIMRYPPGKTDVTGYRPEPWHFRYVGTELAGAMRGQNIQTLEEFFGTGNAPDYN